MERGGMRVFQFYFPKWLPVFGLFALVGCRHAENFFGEYDNFKATSTDDLSTDPLDGGPDASAGEGPAAPRNVVLFIGDGMGQHQIAATGMYKNGLPGTLYFQTFKVHGLVRNASADAEITDSAAAATAMACGRKVNNHVVSLAVPGDGQALPSLVDFYQKRRKSTGLVTTTFMTDATPAAFAAHAKDRYDWDTIAQQYLDIGRPEILFGGGGYGMSEAAASTAGYTVLHSLEGFDPTAASGLMLAGLFGEGYYPYEAVGVYDRPHLYESAAAAVRCLSLDPDGFFVMIEGGMIDRGGHLNRLDFVIGEVIAFERTVRDVMDLVNLDDTLVIVTADHATGDLQIQQNNGRGKWPEVTWGTTGHNVGAVDLFAVGRGADLFKERFETQGGYIDNTEIYALLTTLEP